MSDTVIYHAKKIITMNPNRPLVSHVAVRDRRILAAGSLDEIRQWGDFPVDERFADKVLMPGLVEGHSHIMEGALWAFVYVGFHDRMDPNGKVWPGARDLEAVIQRLVEQEAKLSDPKTPLVAWGFDPIYFKSRRCVRTDLDRVSRQRIIAMMHASGHIINTNSAGLEVVDWLRQGVEHPGIPLGDDGIPTGELKGPEAMQPVMGKTPLDRGFLGANHDGLVMFSRLCVRRGVTTATDLASPLTDDVLATMRQTIGADGYPIRLVPLLRLLADPVAKTIERARWLATQSTDKLRLGRVKLVIDGSIQGFSARIRWPGYFNGAPNGLWYTAPDALREVLSLGLRHGVHIHMHTNGDEATELVLDTMTDLSRDHSWADHRFTFQHCQLADEAQFRRMKALGMGVNLFANHAFYWGDEHYTQTVGPERAERMNACATALRVGVPLAIHSDAPVTPLGPLFTAWCAVNRQTSSGRTLGEAQKIPVADALRAITLGAAYSLKLDSEIGSIEAGKQADFAVLGQDPTEVAPEALRDIPIWGTVLGGEVNEAGKGS
ncbi:MAG: amidohydrolase [Burkholderiaceae bacterium]